MGKEIANYAPESKHLAWGSLSNLIVIAGACAGENVNRLKTRVDKRREVKSTDNLKMVSIWVKHKELLNIGWGSTGWWRASA